MGTNLSLLSGDGVVRPVLDVEVHRNKAEYSIDQTKQNTTLEGCTLFQILGRVLIYSVYHYQTHS